MNTDPFTIGLAVGAACGVFVTAVFCIWIMWPSDGYRKGLPDLDINIPPPPMKPPKANPSGCPHARELVALALRGATTTEMPCNGCKTPNLCYEAIRET